MKTAEIMDQRVKIVMPGDGIELNLHKRGVDLLEETVDEYGINMLQRLVCIAPRVFEKPGRGSIWSEDAMKDNEELREIFNLYASAYGW